MARQMAAPRDLRHFRELRRRRPLSRLTSLRRTLFESPFSIMDRPDTPLRFDAGSRQSARAELTPRRSLVPFSRAEPLLSLLPYAVNTKTLGSRRGRFAEGTKSIALTA